MKARFLALAIVLGLMGVPVSAESQDPLRGPGRVETWNFTITWPGSEILEADLLGPLAGTQSVGVFTIDTRVRNQPTPGTQFLFPENGGFISFFIEIDGVLFTITDEIGFPSFPLAITNDTGEGLPQLIPDTIFFFYDGRVGDAALCINCADEIVFSPSGFPSIPLSPGSSVGFITNFELISVPEPSTLTLLGIGLLAGAAFRKRFK